jgi:integrase
VACRGPLSPPTVTLLKSLPSKRTRLLCTGQGGTKPGSDTALRELLRSLTCDSSTVRCLRSTFRDWVADCASHQPEVAQAALAHVLGDGVRAA